MKVTTTNSNSNAVLNRFNPFEVYDSRGKVVNLDISVKGANTLEEALAIKDMNFNLIKAPMFLEDQTEITNHFAILREDTKEQLGCVGSDYVPVTFKDAFSITDDLVKTGEYGFNFAGVGQKSASEKDYAKGYVGLEGKDIDILGVKHKTNMIGTTAHNGSSGIRLMFTCLNVQCLNGLILGKLASINIQHSSQVDNRMREAFFTIEKQNEYHKALQKTAEEMQKVAMTKKEFATMVVPLVRKEMKMDNNFETESAISTARREEVQNRLEIAWESDTAQQYGNSLYRTLMTLTDFESHSEPFRVSKDDYYLQRIMTGMVLTNSVINQVSLMKGLNLSKIR